MRWQWFLAVTVLMSIGCAKQDYGQCGAPNEHLKVMFKPKITAHPFSHSFCIVCNTQIEPSEYAAWAMEMGAPQGPSNPNDKHPCLYVYGGPPGVDYNIDSLQKCQALACGGQATFNDMVGKNNGNFDLGPILNGSTLVSEEWVLVNDGEMSESQPTDQTPYSNPDPAVLNK